MKHLQFILILFFITACSSTKHNVIKAQKEGAEAPKTNTTIASKVWHKTTKQKDTIKTPKNVISSPATTPIKGSIKKPHHKDFNTLLQKYVSKNGLVNYKALKTKRAHLLSYITYLGQNTPENSWSKEDKLAYWINAYNALTIDLILRHYPVKSIKDIKKPWERRFWKLGNKWYNLNDIEHNILRKLNEPRIHFAIVCASFSCPKLSNIAYTASNIDAQLTTATKDFLADAKRNYISKNSIELSKIFQWFIKDFKQSGNLIDFLNQYSHVKISAKARKTYKDYNWSLNE
ncbi:DUF547 domain-containing protein [Postechiella marina]|uniref:DUF547 domain-containing protein n=1 Tax=Postechiella marina TaxID=943941 RepID=A0ABP8CFE8_9FLAO